VAEFLKALRAALPGAPLAAPDIAGDTSRLAPFIQALGREVVFLTCHYYSEGPASRPGVTMNKMLGSGEALAKIIDSVARYTAGSGLKVRMAESNSVFGGGKAGISDTLGAALWGVDVMFTLADARWLGINFHGGGNYYTPFAQTSSGAFEPKPLYYAMLLFAYAGRGSLGPITREVCDHGCEPSSCEALAANIESFLLTGLLPKMNMSALPQRGRKQPSCG
jgi:hypothetical protein